MRVRCRADNPVPLTDLALAPRLIESVRFYCRGDRWWPHVFLLMPDHWHALLCFPASESMSGVIGHWKRFHALRNGIMWQDNYFDHRLRHDESLEQKAAYICNNPVAKGLCERPEDWPWAVFGASLEVG